MSTAHNDIIKTMAVLSTMDLSGVCGAQQALTPAEQSLHKKMEDCVVTGHCEPTTPEEAMAGRALMERAGPAGVGNHIALHQEIQKWIFGNGQFLPPKRSRQR